ncbi:MAG: helix-turn-helix transcriptional regulator [Candidatus Parcubacteria bacterium]|nr:helix-turn-helix transcriptional regulator [Candidatus Parcubacteria bacterium]
MSIGKLKTAKQMERHLKGVANHHRIEILLAIASEPGLTLEEIIEQVKANEKTIGEHTRRLSQAGLVNKKYKGKFVTHELSIYGKMFVKFLQSFQRL